MIAKPFALFVDHPTTQNERDIEAEITWLVDAEVFNERGQDREFAKIANRIAALRMDDAVSWDEAFVDLPYAKTWDAAKVMQLIREGRDAELGALIREATTREFCADVFNAAELEWKW